LEGDPLPDPSDLTQALSIHLGQDGRWRTEAWLARRNQEANNFRDVQDWKRQAQHQD